MADGSQGSAVPVAGLPQLRKGRGPAAPIAKDINSLSSAVAAMNGVTHDGMQPAMLRLVRTVAGEESYPDDTTEPNTYNIKFYQPHQYTKSPGKQTITKTARHADSAADDVMLNLAALGAWSAGLYIPVDTDIWAFQLGGRWFTWFGAAGGESLGFYKYEITGSVVAGSPRTAKAKIYDADDETSIIATNQDWVGNCSIFDDQDVGSVGICVKSGSKYYAVNAPGCGADIGSSAGVYLGPVAPSDTSLVWIDTSGL